MRKIVFRGKRVDNGKWVYGDLIHAAFYGTNVFEYGIVEYGCCTVEVDGKTVGQFIGLKDFTRTDKYPHGRDIFNGDIFKAKIKGNDGFAYWLVEYVDHSVYSGYKCYGVNRRFNVKLTKSLIAGCNLEIVGNKHDNHELLGGVK